MPSYRTPGEQVIATPVVKEPDVFGGAASFDINPIQGTGQQQRPFQPIQFGKPLNVLLRRIYTGRFPKRGIFGGNKPMLLTSALKDISTTAAATRAVNMLKPSVSPKSAFSGIDAAEQGTTLIYYSPALTSPFLTISVTMIFEDFPQELFSHISALFTSLAGIPIFMPASGYLLGASTIVKLAGDIGDQLVNGTPALSENLQLDFAFGGGAIPQAGYWILSSGAFDGSDFQYDPVRGLLSKSSNTPYSGDDPLIVLSVDGSAVDNVASFTPLAASADLLGRFFTQKDGSEVATDTIMQAARLMNDLTFRKKADETKQKLANLPANATADERKQLQDALDAFNKNIGEKLLQI